MKIGEIIKDIRLARTRERDKFDKLIITLTAGAIVLSVPFVSQLTEIEPASIKFLFLSWVLLLIALFCIVIAYLTVDRHFIRMEKDILYSKKYGGIWGAITDLLTISSSLFMLAGILFLAKFVMDNIL